MNIVKLLKRSFIIGLVSFVLPQAAFAATLDDVVVSIRDFHRYVESVVNTTKTALIEKLYELNPNMAPTILGNQGQAIGRANLTNNIYRLTLDQVKQGLSLQEDKTKQNALIDLAASDNIPILPPALSALFGKQHEAINTAAGDSNFDAETLVGTTVYIPSREAQARNFILAATGTYQSITHLPLEGLSSKQLADLQRMDVYREYRLALRSYIAGQSLALDNFYRLLAERIVQPGLGTQTGLFNSNGQPIKDASPLQVKEYLATRRASNPHWYDAMAKASPATVSRETLFVLAEIRQELFNLQQQNERLLLTMSGLAMQSTAGNKINLQRLQGELKEKINTNIKGLPPSAPNPLEAPAGPPPGSVPNP
jgi:hypothetical protein